MKYIKSFEATIKPIFKEGDYIYYLSHTAYGAEHEPYAKILKGKSPTFQIEHYNNKGIYSINWIDELYFVKLLTPEEIKEYEQKKEANKYNL